VHSATHYNSKHAQVVSKKNKMSERKTVNNTSVKCQRNVKCTTGYAKGKETEPLGITAATFFTGCMSSR